MMRAARWGFGALAALLLVVMAAGVGGALIEIGRLSASPLVDAAGGYDIGRATAITHLYLQAVLMAVMGLGGVGLAGVLAWRFDKAIRAQNGR